MLLNPAIFKAYDIRGVYAKDFDAEAARRIARAFAMVTKAKTVVVGRDMRASGDEIAPAVIDGLLSEGLRVVNIGLCTTPMFNFAVASRKGCDGGIMITASHNPKEFNGMKLARGGAVPIGRGMGMEDIREFAEKGVFEDKAGGRMEEVKVLEEYLDKVFSVVDVKHLRPMKVVVDAGNGMQGMVAPAFFSRLSQMTMVSMYFELDGTFPHHEANPIKEENVEDLKKRVKAEGADVGIAYDADADRIGFVDEKGVLVRGDMIQAILAREVLARHPKATVLYDLRSSNALPEEIARLGGKPKMSMVGHALIKKMMREENAVFAGELSAHYYYEDFYGVESGDVTTLLLLKLLSETGKSLSELVAPLKKYAHSGEMNFAVEEKEEVIGRVAERFRDEAQSQTDMDGIRMDFDGWWFSLRSSNTEPLLRLIVEAKDEKTMQEKVEEVSQLLS